MSRSRLPRVALAIVIAAGVSGLAAAPAWAAPPTCSVEKMPGVNAAWGRYSRTVSSLRQAPSADPRDDRQVAVAAGAREELLRVVTVILGAGPEASEDAVAELEQRGAPGGHPIACTRTSWTRDRLAYQLLSTGYSAQEVVDILTGHLAKAEIDHARRLLLAGYGEQRAADYLDKAVAGRLCLLPGRGATSSANAVARARSVPRPSDLGLRDPRLDATLVSLARMHGVDPVLVRAMVNTESGGQIAATSSRGALGLMQLMPGTARMLGVNPLDPYQNLQGGIAYLAGLVRQFGDVRSALVAYNAGPTHAERVRRGEAALYGETRRYLERIAGLTGVTSYLPGR